MPDPAPALASEPDPRGQRVLDSARRHFAAKGFEAARLAEIARDAGVAVGTVYLRHRDKADLLGAVLRAVDAEFAAAMTHPAVLAAPWPDRFRRIFEAVFAEAERQADLMALMALAPFARAEGWTPGAAVRAAIAAQIREGQEEGALRSSISPDLAAAIGYGMVEGAMLHAMRTGPEACEEALAELETIARGWLVDEKARPGRS